MPVIHNFNYNEIPAWAQLKKWEIYKLPLGHTVTIDTGYSRCGVYLMNGNITVDDGKERVQLWRRMGQDVKQIHLFHSGKITVEVSADDNWWNENTIAVYSGDWTDEDHPKMGGFECSNNERPYNHGDPVDYPFFTTFPNHYHEYDEYFLIMRGRGIFMDDGVLYNVEPGDLVATRRGVHHQVVACWDDVMICSEFGSRLGGQMRPYFLYEHTHGKPLCED